jgi:methionine-rich copper-binding protein CopC
MVSLLSVRRLAALLGLSVVWLLLWCTPALAHARLLETDPTDGARLSQPPEQVRLRFNEPIEAEFSPLKVFDPQGNWVDRDNAHIASDDARVLVADLEELPEGSRTGVYTVEWRVTSADGHPVNGTYGFNVTGASTDESQSGTQVAAEDTEESGQQDAGSISAHAIHVVGLAIGIVVVLVLALLQRAKGKGPS